MYNCTSNEVQMGNTLCPFYLVYVLRYPAKPIRNPDCFNSHALSTSSKTVLFAYQCKVIGNLCVHLAYLEVGSFSQWSYQDFAVSANNTKLAHHFFDNLRLHSIIAWLLKLQKQGRLKW